jgi:hypothetical protein
MIVSPDDEAVRGAVTRLMAHVGFAPSTERLAEEVGLSSKPSPSTSPDRDRANGRRNRGARSAALRAHATSGGPRHAPDTGLL